MIITGTIPPKPVEEKFRNADAAIAVAAFRHLHPGARVETVDGQFVRAVCTCGQPIMINDTQYSFDPVRGWKCMECFEKERDLCHT